MIVCNTLSGHPRRVAAAKLIFRPSVYAIIPSDGRIVLMTMQSTGQYGVPGGAVELGERREAALMREVREETGLQVTVGRLLHVEETFFYYEPTRQAFHQFSFFDLCAPQTLSLCADDQVDDGEQPEATCPRWIDPYALRPHDIQGFRTVLFRLLPDVLPRS
jgi:8-oxo-dGTP pyrophosphatase MutT (NUDIX family)